MHNDVIDRRYRIVEELGRGGMGIVYKVHDVVRNCQLALKTLPTIFQKTDFQKRFKNEFITNVSLKHLNLIEVFDFGTDENQIPYFTMEFIPGWNLRTFPYIQDMKTILPLVIQVCHALDYVHSRGLVHRDIKPTNILVFQDPENQQYKVKITDFGLATNKLEVSTVSPSGTLAFMAPEVLNGEQIDQLSDVYAFGVVLYHVMTGSFPFISDDAHITLKERLHAPVIEPKSFNPTIPEALNALILKCLQYKKTDRFHSFTEIRERLVEILTPDEEIPSVQVAGKELFHSHFIGRTLELEKLKGEFEKLLAGTSSIIAIDGETGIGKSRLLRECKYYVQVKHHLVVMTQFGPSLKTSGLPLTHLIESLAFFVAARKKELIQDYLPYLKTIIPHICESIQVKPISDLACLDPQAEKVRLYTGLLDFFQTVSQDFPIVLILEDLHYASQDELDFLETLLTRLEQSKVLCIFSNTRDFAISNPLFCQFLDHLKENPFFKRIIMRRFDCAHTRQLICSIVGDIQSEDKLCELIHAKTEGNPLYVREYLQHLVNEGGLIWNKQTWNFIPDETRKIPVPESIQEMLKLRIERLSREQLHIIQSFAVYGREFDLQIIRKAFDLSPSELRAHMHQLILQGFIEILPAVSGEYFSFTHSIYREIIYQQTPVQKRKKLHLFIARILEKNYEKKSPIPVGTIALHYLNGGNFDRGIPYAFQDAQYQLSIYSYTKAAFFFNEIINYLRYSKSEQLKQEFLVKTLTLLREIYSTTGDWDKALLMNKKLRKLAPSDSMKNSCSIQAAQIYFDKGDYKTALRLLTVVHKMLPKNSSSILAGRVKLLKSSILEYRGKSREAIQLCQHAINIFEQKSENDFLADAYNSLGTMYQSLGQVQKSIKWFIKSLKMRRKRKNRFGEAASLNNVSLAFQDMGLFSAAIKFCHKSIDLNKDIGNLRSLANNYSNLANIYYDLDAYDLMLENQIQGLKIYEAIKDIRGQATAFNNLGIANQMIGEFEEAHNYLLSSLELKKKIGDIPLLISGYNNLGQFFLIIRQFDKALLYHKTAFRLCRRTGNLPLQATTYTFLAEDNLRLGDFVKAERYLEYSLDIARKIQRKDFLYGNYRIEAQLCIIKGEWKKAREAIDNFLEKARRRKSKSAEGIGLRLLSEWCLNQSKFKEAETWFEQSIECFQKIKNQYELALTTKKYGEIIIYPFPEKGKSLLMQALDIFEKLKLDHEIKEIRKQIADIGHKDTRTIQPNRNLQILIEASKAMMSMPDLDRLLNFLIDKALLITGAQRGFLVLLDEKYRLQVKAIRHFTEKEFDENVRFSSTVIQEVLLQQTAIIIPDTMTDDRFHDKSSIIDFDIRSIIGVPLHIPKIHYNLNQLTDESKLSRDIIGVIYLDSQVKQHVFMDYDLNCVITLANDAALAIQNTNLFRLATIDGLTRTYIFRYFQQRLKEELLRASRFRRHLSLLMIDIDYFKAYNDRYGHQAGNLILRSLAMEVKSLLRTSDILCRFGGEEFALIMPETDAPGAMVVAEKVRQKIENLIVNETQVTVSIGVSSFPEHDIKGRGDFIEKSDFALYQAKLLGRNRSVLFNPDDLQVTTEVDKIFIPHSKR
ncbi:diguanylate cyclase [candidate division CSSED10-310 bacterium]|uniref:Diguanylate cyclase n=1 Tax=candidate division CSSED10-310 bacterium TaxID=2855610 RepID=A0ABV6YUY4_UNCC1